MIRDGHHAERVTVSLSPLGKLGLETMVSSFSQVVRLILHPRMKLDHSSVSGHLEQLQASPWCPALYDSQHPRAPCSLAEPPEEGVV